MKRYLPLFCSFFLVFTVCVTRDSVDTEKVTQEVKLVIDRFYQLYTTKDLDLLSKIVAHDEDMVNLGTDSVEYWVGWESLNTAFQKQWESFEKPEITYRNQSIKISQSRTVSWYSMLLDFTVVFEGKTVRWTGARTTGILEKREGEWKIVQFHNSMPVLIPAADY
ncbi:nuclear transport factor 2 family protein [candidate division KSB1 bacterium]|nr:nuclear transport factor 2 family protein [candidate division KSB1 bacterium]